MPFTPTRVLLIGATAGIGAAVADHLIHAGSKVTAVGRRQDRLDAFVAKHGAEKASAVRFDIGDGAGMDGFVETITKEYPDIDCIWLNAGVQTHVDFTKPGEVDLAAFHRETAVNFTAIVDLTVKFLPFLMLKGESSLVFTGSHLSLIPAAGLPAYSASKAALGSFVLSLREQLRASKDTQGVRVVEVFPPVTQTELHDHMGPSGRSFGMPVTEFVEKAFEGLDAGSDQVVVGTIAGLPYEDFVRLAGERRAATEGLAKIMRGGK
ncbi:NAD(P)-binding protein, partial [Lophium mytilinum]